MPRRKKFKKCVIHEVRSGKTKKEAKKFCEKIKDGKK